ncbi:MAG TPA: hypothetical protein VF557_12810 [Jatrophihabitans sp.]|uniref:hypothetical protein n=1 Tax=Jatrophihabitans sp. TaxID=1932789 RepID=UPI002EDFAAE6
MSYHDDPAGYAARLEAKLAPARIRATLAFAGLYQITHEMIKQSVVDEVRLFYRTGFQDRVWTYDEVNYEAQVLRKAPKNKFRASVLWLVEGGALTLEQADRLTAIYSHRHELSHELIKYIIDPDLEPDLDLLTDALTILKAIRRFWTSIELDIGTFEDHGDVDLDEIVPLSLMALQQCIDAYVAGLDEVDQSE